MVPACMLAFTDKNIQKKDGVIGCKKLFLFLFFFFLLWTGRLCSEY
jgi:hypothetical protein